MMGGVIHTDTSALMVKIMKLFLLEQMVLMGERIWMLTSALKTFNEPLKKRSQNFSKGFSFLEILSHKSMCH